MAQPKRRQGLLGFFSRRKTSKEQRFDEYAPDAFINGSRSLDQVKSRPHPAPSVAFTTIHSFSTLSLRSTPSWSLRNLRAHEFASWDPPPLFQVYPQSIKHAVLDASCLPTDVILRISENKLSGLSVDPAAAPPSQRHANEPRPNKSPPRLKRHSRKLSASISTGGWTQKLFVLVTSGYLLQYAAEGDYDRLPEKVMQLCAETVAFASDAIPGRHWVLQVSNDGAIKPARTNPGFGIWSSLSPGGTGSKCDTNAILLVCDSAEDLGVWMATIRKEIQLIGGRHYYPESPDAETVKPMLKHRISRTFRVDKEIVQISRSIAKDNAQAASGGLSFRSSTHFEESISVPEKVVHRMSRGYSFETSSVASATDLDRLRDSNGSRISALTGTRTSFDGSSQSARSTSPTRDLFPDDATQDSACLAMDTLTSVRMAGQAALSSVVTQRLAFDISRRQSFNPTLVMGSTGPESPHGATRIPRPLSLVPNFSLPTSSNRTSYERSFEATTVPLRLSIEPKSPVQESTDENDEEKPPPTRGRPLSTIGPLPDHAALRKSSRSMRTLAETRAIRRASSTPRLGGDSDMPFDRQVARLQSVVPPGPGHAKPLRRYSTLTASRSMVSLSRPPEIGLPLPPQSRERPQRQQPSVFSPLELSTLAVPGQNSKVIRRPHSIQVTTSRRGEAQAPERSPAVTDAHFATCFGTEKPFNRKRFSDLSPLAPNEVDGRDACRIQRLMARRSTPLLSSLAPQAPVGPPPTCPLPAVPAQTPPRERRRDTCGSRESVLSKRTSFTR